MTGALGCLICGGDRIIQATRDYRACLNCRHESLVLGQVQTFMTNDRLTPEAHFKPDFLVRFQSRVVESVRCSDRLLIDIGCGSGKFLLHCRASFRSVFGVEVNAKNSSFATQILGLQVHPSLPSDISPPSVVTFWHSLEHIPAESMMTILEKLRAVCGEESRIVISVPNSRSLQYRVFRERYAFYDAPNHLHQFSPLSLDMVMRRYGFIKSHEFFSPAYIFFGNVQGLLNLVIPIHNYFYYRRKRGANFGLAFPKLLFFDCLSVLLLLPAVPIGLILTMVDYALTEGRGVLTACYRKGV